MVEFGEQLRRAREDKGITQQTLANQLYVTRQSVSHLECGDRYPDLLTTKKISEILDISLDDLLSGKDMSKVIESSPVIENKKANNFIIVFYTFVVFSRIFQFVDVLSRCIPPMKLWDFIKLYPYNFSMSFITWLKILLIISVFSYGLVQAVKREFTPKKVGAVIFSYFTVSFICTIAVDIVLCAQNNWDATFLEMNIVNFVLYSIQFAIGAVASYFYFIRNYNKIFWPILILLVSGIGIFAKLLDVFSTSLADLPKWHIDLTSFLVDEITPIILFSLVIYQVVMLYLKRKI